MLDLINYVILGSEIFTLWHDYGYSVMNLFRSSYIFNQFVVELNLVCSLIFLSFSFALIWEIWYGFSEAFLSYFFFQYLKLLFCHLSLGATFILIMFSCKPPISNYVEPAIKGSNIICLNLSVGLYIYNFHFSFLNLVYATKWTLSFFYCRIFFNPYFTYVLGFNLLFWIM